MKRLSVLIATLMRPELQRLLDSLRKQTLRQENWELLTWGPAGELNEYDARNRLAKAAKGEVLCFLDDDSYVPPDYLERGLSKFDSPEIKVMDCAMEGDFWGQGKIMRLDNVLWGVGATLWARRDAFLEVGGFETDWGIKDGSRVRGWRSDTDIMLRIISRFGPGSYVHSSDMTVHHPESMKAVWDYRVEALFYKRWRSFCLERFAPIDPRLCDFVVKYGIERDERVIRKMVRDPSGIMMLDPRIVWVVNNSDPPIIDIGSGDGLTFAGLNKDVVNFDMDLYRAERFVRGDGLLLPFRDGSFQTSILGEILEHVEDPLALLSEALRVSRSRVLVTTPLEHEWDKSLSPCVTREQRMTKDGFKSVNAMAKNFVGSYQRCQAITDEGVRAHLWHRNWWDRQQLSALLDKTGREYSMENLRHRGFVWALIKIKS